MSVLLITVFYNRSKEVHSSVSSLLDAAPLDCKIILIDDGSTESTLVELNKFSNDSRVDVLTQENTGFVKTLSKVIPKCIERYKPEYIGVFGAGDICKKDKYTKQLVYLENHKDVVALGCGHETISNSTGATIGEVKGELVSNSHNLYTDVPFTHGTVIYRTDAYLKSGGYNDLFKFCQDWELYFRLLPYGKVVRYPEVLYSKYIFNDGASFKPQKKIEQIKYRELVLTRKKSDIVFEENVKKLKVSNIDEVISISNYKEKYKKFQLNLILKGEFELAKEWSKFIDPENRNATQKILVPLLKILKILKFPSILFANMFNILSKLK